jgi:sec-independent protein translocase protein TatB
LKENLGPGFEDLDVTDLTPKNLAKKVIGNAMDDVKPVVNEVKKQSRDIKDVAKIDPDLL